VTVGKKIKGTQGSCPHQRRKPFGGLVQKNPKQLERGGRRPRNKIAKPIAGSSQVLVNKPRLIGVGAIVLGKMLIKNRKKGGLRGIVRGRRAPTRKTTYCNA